MTEPKNETVTEEGVFISLKVEPEIFKQLEVMTGAYDLDRSKLIRHLIRKEYRRYTRKEAVTNIPTKRMS